MPDAITLPSDSKAVSMAVAVAQADGFVVVSRSTKYDAVIPKRAPAYSYDHCATLNDAADKYAEYERGEYNNWREVGIFAVKDGMPLGPKLDPMTLARVTRSAA